MPAFLRFGFGLALLALAGCVAPQPAVQPAPPTATAAASPAPSAGLPPLGPPFRPDLDPKWRLGTGGINWPLNDGFAAPPVLMVLPSGMLLDRFGSENGNFFSPKGAGFGGRALPYGCALIEYHVYEVERPLLAWTGAAAQWFGQAGGGTQIKTDANVAALLASGTLAPVKETGAKPCP